MENNEFQGKYSDGDREEVLYTSEDNEGQEPTLLKTEKIVPSDSVFLYICAFTGNLIMFSCGSTLAWSSPVFPKLKEVDLEINPLGKPITSTQESLIVGIMSFGAALGPLFAGESANTIGRKQTLLIAALPKIIGYLAITFFPNIYVYYVGRFLTGLGLGTTFAILPMYIGEITQDHNRGKFSCIIGVFVALGLLYPFAVGPLLSFKLFTFSCTIPLMLFLIFFQLFIPESPTFLVSVGKKKEAENALVRLRNRNKQDVQAELHKIFLMVEKEQKGEISDLFKNATLSRAIIITTGLVFIQQFSGISAVNAFLGPIFAATGSNLSPYISSIIVGIIQVFTTIIAASLVEKLGRKFLLLSSIIGAAASIILLGLYFYIKNNEIYAIDSIFWLPVASLIIYIISFNVGLGPIPWALVAEIFPAHIRSIAASATSFVCFMSSTLVTVGFPLIVAHVGMAQCFWIFGSICILGTVFTFYIVPETKGKTLDEIQQLLSKR